MAIPGEVVLRQPVCRGGECHAKLPLDVGLQDPRGYPARPPRAPTAGRKSGLPRGCAASSAAGAAIASILSRCAGPGPLSPSGTIRTRGGAQHRRNRSSPAPTPAAMMRDYLPTISTSAVPAPLRASWRVLLAPKPYAHEMVIPIGIQLTT